MGLHGKRPCYLGGSRSRDHHWHGHGSDKRNHVPPKAGEAMKYWVLFTDADNHELCYGPYPSIEEAERCARRHGLMEYRIRCEGRAVRV